MKRELLLFANAAFLSLGVISWMADGGAPAPPWPRPPLLADGGAPAPPWPRPPLLADGGAPAPPWPGASLTDNLV